MYISIDNESKKRTLIYELNSQLIAKKRKKISDEFVVSLLTYLNEKGCSARGKESKGRKNNTWHRVSFFLSPSFSCIHKYIYINYMGADNCIRILLLVLFYRKVMTMSIGEKKKLYKRI